MLWSAELGRARKEKVCRSCLTYPYLQVGPLLSGVNPKFWHKKHKFLRGATRFIGRKAGRPSREKPPL